MIGFFLALHTSSEPPLPRSTGLVRSQQSPAWLRYSVAVASVALAVAVALALRPLTLQYPSFIFFAAIVFSAWIGKVPGGLLATAISAVALLYFFLPPFETFDKSSNPDAQVRFVIFLVIAAFINLLNLAHRRAEAALMQLTVATEAERLRLTRILEQIPLGIYLAEGEPANRTMRWTFINREGTAQLSAPTVTPGVVSETFTVYYPDGRLYSDDELPIQRTLWTGRSVIEQEMVFRYHNGQERIFEATTGVLREHAGSREVVEVLKDVTESKRLQEQVRQQTEVLKAEYERLATIVSAANISLSIMDAECRLILVNDEWERRSGFMREEVLGRRYLDFTEPDFFADHQAAVDQVLATGRPVTYIERFMRNPRKPEGIYVDWSLLPVSGPGGEISMLLSTSIDVTEKVLARQQVEAQRSLLDTIIEGAPVGLSFLDRDMRLVNFNTYWAEMMGIDPQSALGSPLYDLLPWANERRDIHLRVLAGEEIYLPDVEYTHPESGTQNYYDFHYNPLGVQGMLVSVVDVTVRHELDRQKDDFIALATHELKSPITTIKGYSQLALHASRHWGLQLDERLLRALRTIDNQVARLNRLVDELLDVSRLQEGALTLHPEPFDLSDLVGEVVASLELTAPGFTFNLALPDAAATVRADRPRVEQVLTNLLQNAVKYSTGRLQVDVDIRFDDGQVITSVRDYGVGIPAHEQAHVFDRFFRAANVQGRHAGLGLGLFISHSIIERHGGRMWVESTEGQGSTFYFALAKGEV